MSTAQAGREDEPLGRGSDTGDVPDPIRSDPNPGLLRALLHGVYDGLWLLAIVVGSPWWIWRCLRRPPFRRMVRERLGIGERSIAQPSARRVLVHGVSVGEVKGAASLVRALAAQGLDVVVSATTDTGLTVGRQLYPELPVVRFPFDLSFVTRAFLRRVQADCVVLVELEIWPNFLRECNRAGLPVTVVNGRITGESHSSYLVFRRLLPQFNRITLFCVQSQEYADRFLELAGDPRRMIVTGNLKVDGLDVGEREPDPALARLLGGRPGQPVFVAGSTHEPEELLVARACRDAAPNARLVLVPRHPNRAPAVAAALAAEGFPCQRLTELRAGAAPDPDRPAIVDTIGELEDVYALADLVFVGGSLVPHGGQNMLEPAARGRPVLYGPNVANFREEARLLEDAGAARRLAGTAELAGALAELLADPAARRGMADAGMAAVRSQRGATALTLEALGARCGIARG